MTRIDRIRAELWAITVLDPDELEHTITVADGELSMESVRLATWVVQLLWQTKRGATPLAIGG